LDWLAKMVLEKLHEIAESGLEKGHYPIDLTQGFSTELPHLARLRDYARRLAFEADLCVIKGDYEGLLKAFRSMASIYKSLEHEPFLISQLVNFAITGIMCDHIDWIFSHCELPEDVLLKLNDIITMYYVPKEERSKLGLSYHTELLAFLDLLKKGNVVFVSSHISSDSITEKKFNSVGKSWFPITDIMYPAGLEAMLAVNLYSSLMEACTKVTREENVEVPEKQFIDLYFTRLFEDRNSTYLFKTAPPCWLYFMTMIVFPALQRTIEAELRHHVVVELIKTAIAVERFRQKNNRLPGNLEELVPDYLSEVPKDPWNKGEPIKYIKEENFGFKVYSIGMDREDDGGISRDPESGGVNIRKFDIPFSVPPLEIRRQPPVSKDISLLSICAKIEK